MKRGLSSILLFVALIFCAHCGSQSIPSTEQSKSQVANAADTDVVGSVSAMTQGDLYYVDFDSSGSSNISFANAGSDAEYMLVVQSTTSTSSTVGVIPSDLSNDPAARLDIVLRNAEAEISKEPPETRPISSIGKSFVEKSVGDVDSFNVLRSISGSYTYEEVLATNKCVMDHVMVYLDNDVPDTDLDATDMDTLCDQFEYAVALEESILGEPSDVNDDGHVVILVTLAVNRLGASGGGIITGYFFANDLTNGSNSNNMEIIYILAPDPEGTYGTDISKEFAMESLMTAVVPHELQHAINFNQHSIVNGGSAEENWLNEAMSHFAEDLVGFGQENPSRYEGFLLSPQTVSLAPSSSPDLDERGAEYLFMRYLYEQSSDPNGFLARLEDTTNRGKDNIVAAFAGSDVNFDEWNEFMRRWAIALALTDTGISLTPQYQFHSRTLNATTGHWQGACLICDTDDGRGTILTGPYAPELSVNSMSLSLSGTATGFYSIISPPSSVSLSGSPSAGLQGVLIRTY